ncbi:MAG TPA: DUF4388 domain-containing protein [Polyangiaceae bacterium]|nr:DUF4388 domain-containing protein [Polyangiaceae bacterium]
MKDVRSELVRIDPSGVAHPIGNVASQRMRARAGAFRLLPAPEHVVFMRFTGEDGRRDADDGAVVRLAGEIVSPGAMCDVFALLGQTGWRGELCVMDGASARSVFFDQGNVVGAQTNVEAERIGMVLYKFGVITNEEHERIMDRVQNGARYGAAAVELGLVPQERVFEYLGKQIDEVVYSTLTVSDGTYFFLDGFEETRLVAHHAVGANALLMDAVTRMDEMRYFRERVPSADYIPFRLRASEPPPPEFQATFAAIDGALTIEGIGRATGRGEFETTKDVYGLLRSKHVAVHPPRLDGGLAAVVETANEALRHVHREADAAAIGGDLRASLSSFAVGAGVYDILFRGAGPDELGALDAERVAENASLVAHGDDPERILKQMLFDYVGFAVFSAGSVLGSEREAELSRSLAAITSRLKP